MAMKGLKGRNASKAKAKPAKGTAKRGKSAKAASKKSATRPTTIAKAEKAEGDLPVKAYIGSLPAWQREVARRFDSVVGREVPRVRRAVKWSAAFYGVPDQGWFASVKGFRNVVKVTFFKGTSLKPVPAAGSSEEARSHDLKQSDSFDEAAMTKWVKQASAMPGWGS